jgi:hypothetical protein
MESAREPPVKENRFLRFMKFITPKKWHGIYTKEFFIGWNVSSWVTLGQVAAAKWIAATLKPFAELVAKWWSEAKMFLANAKDALLDALDIMFNLS